MKTTPAIQILRVRKDRRYIRSIHIINTINMGVLIWAIFKVIINMGVLIWAIFKVIINIDAFFSLLIRVCTMSL